MSSKNLNLACRLADILAKLNQGERLEVNELAEEFNVTPRTIMRDLKDRLVFLQWEECGPRYYSLSKSTLGQLYQEDIERFAHFASIQNLFPKIDREFFQKQLTQSIYVKGHNYEDISHKTADFELIKAAIEAHQYLDFSYHKNGGEVKNYRVSPYLLLNRSGIWYLIAIDSGQVKTFSFAKISQISVLKETFTIDPHLLAEIKQNDSIYYGNQIDEVTIKVDASVANYFIRRKLLPNQIIQEENDEGDLIVVSQNVAAQEILALMRYWIPNVEILSPQHLQIELEEGLRQYLTTRDQDVKSAHSTK